MVINNVDKFFFKEIALQTKGFTFTRFLLTGSGMNI